ncbi:MAG: TraR/DksA C4-type zinc finger protein [Armatimonadota bacterium]|nr:TraR/DksA C4-type zinc finger protein [Armatimonadota bacterium]MDR7464764.1 TraR/DksA C4-type zinc finger protein [Armatimonadota bacterium]MDR7468541.1 TraR/DksA C4-type zinc finger protein [Armatimonadota bacterium]MDR7475134.1 TraR/DksA C4-type zinc finger protein [Armatimonadota bacterium]MDR7539655.1 TraR/DksA C4-type zinc finger protein [Armatimonadota bacterium]
MSGLHSGRSALRGRPLRKFEVLLRRERAEVLDLLAAWPGTETDPVGYGHTHPAEAASTLYDREEALSVKAWLLHRLAEIDAALQRIREGTYGRCEVCGNPIERRRLEALPTARLRVKCQERLEREAQRGRPQRV